MEALARRAAGERRVALLDLTREYRAYRHELLAACDRVLERMQLLGGEEVRAFESEMAAYLGVRQVCGVASGTDALALALQAAGLEPGDEVLVQANAFVAGGEAIQRAGGTPVAVDISLDDLGPDPDDLAARLTPPSRAILVVHLHGLPVDLPPILQLPRAIGVYAGGPPGRSAAPPRPARARPPVYHRSVVPPRPRAGLRPRRAGGNMGPGGPSRGRPPRRPAWRGAYGEPPPLPRAERA